MSAEMQMCDVPVDSIVGFEYERKPKKIDIEILSESIRRVGQKVPIMAYRLSEGKFAGIYGKHRLVAAKKNGKTAVRALVFDTRPDGPIAPILRFLENAFPTQWSPQQKKDAIAWMHEHGKTPEEIANAALMPVVGVRQVLIEKRRIAKDASAQPPASQSAEEPSTRESLIERAKAARRRRRTEKASRPVPASPARQPAYRPPVLMPSPAGHKDRESPVYAELRDVEQNVVVLQENAVGWDGKIKMCETTMRELCAIPEVATWLKNSKHCSLMT